MVVADILVEERTATSIGDRFGELPTEDIVRNDIEWLLDSTNGQLYFFERLNISKNYLDRAENQASFLVQVLQGNPIRIDNDIWKLSLETVEEVENEDPYGRDIFLIGYLIKYDQEYVEVARARFFLEVESGLLAYHLVQFQINDQQFRQFFCKAIKDASINLSITIQAVIYPLDKKWII